MSEFMDVIRTVQRICKRSKCNCSLCILDEFACPNNVRFDTTDEAQFLEFEDVVIKWAEENPEPQYPTWYEWLLANGAITKDTDPFGCVATHYHFNCEIPVDIAQKYGIEPKRR